jgi:hypothetical protein
MREARKLEARSWQAGSRKPEFRRLASDRERLTIRRRRLELTFNGSIA